MRARVVGVGLALMGCNPGVLSDHCTVTRGPDGAVRSVLDNEMRGGLLRESTLFFGVDAEPAGIATHTFEGGRWVREDFNGDPSESVVTASTRLTWDGDLPLEKVVRNEVAGRDTETIRWTWSGDQLEQVEQELDGALFSTETWTWSGETASIRRETLSGTVQEELRRFRDSRMTWPALTPFEDLPNRALEARGADLNGNGALDADEVVFERVFDGDLPSEDTQFDGSGEVVFTRSWGECP